MKKDAFRSGLHVLVLSFVLGTAHAQFKAPASPASKTPLGSGLYVPPPESERNAPTPPAEDERSLDDVVQDIANCVLPSLPKDWIIAQIEVTELSRDGKQREFEAKYTYVGIDGKDTPFTPCDRKEPAVNVYKLNRALEPAKRDWKKATLVLSSEGKFELKYDYDRPDVDKPAGAATDSPSAKPAAKAAAKPEGKAATKK